MGRSPRFFGKMRDRGVIEADRVFEIIDQRAEPGPEHDGARRDRAENPPA